MQGADPQDFQRARVERVVALTCSSPQSSHDQQLQSRTNATSSSGCIEMAWVFPSASKAATKSPPPPTTATHPASGCWVFSSKVPTIVEWLDFQDTDKSMKNTILAASARPCQNKERVVGPASSPIQPTSAPPPTVAAIALVRPWRGIFELTLDPRWERFASKGQL